MDFIKINFFTKRHHKDNKRCGHRLEKMFAINLSYKGLKFRIPKTERIKGKGS